MPNTFMMEVGNVATAYEPYITPVTLTIALGTTVYGGSLDVKTGVGTITHALGTLTGAESESWEMTSGDGWHQFYTAISASLSSADSISNRFEPI